MHERIQPDLLKRLLAESIFSSHIHYAPRMDSTNALGKALAVQGAPEGTLVLTEEQSAGRGRRGRTWLSPPSANLLFSILVRPAMDGDRVFGLTMILALAAVHAVKNKTGLSAGIKWPNDVYLGAKKVAGILTEFSLIKKKVDWAVLGMGVNVSWYPEGSRENGAPATSLVRETGRSVSRADLLAEILKGFEGFYRQMSTEGPGRLYREWNRRCLVLGREVRVEGNGETLRGKAVRIEENGALVIENGAGELQRVVCGDVSLRLES